MKVLYSDMAASIMELMDCHCAEPEENSSAEVQIKEYDQSIAECSAMLEHFLFIKRNSAEGSFQHENANEEISFWSRMLKTAKTERRRLITA